VSVNFENSKPKLKWVWYGSPMTQIKERVVTEHGNEFRGNVYVSNTETMEGKNVTELERTIDRVNGVTQMSFVLYESYRCGISRRAR